jgi:hypothetical protein
MTLVSLLDVNLEKFVADNRDAGGCWFFVHIPKTAGSSFGTELTALLSPNFNVNVDDDKRPVPYPQKVITATKGFNERLKQGPCRFASGHIPVQTLTTHVEGWRDLNLITMLRDPVTRVVSDYRYQRTPLHPARMQFIRSFPTLESYARTARGRNKMFRFLRPFPNASLEECKEFIVNRFAFVGVVEMYPLSFRLMTRMLGQERGPSHHVRKTMETEHNHVEVTPELIKTIRELNSQDMELYGYFRSKLLPLRQLVFG